MVPGVNKTGCVEALLNPAAPDTCRSWTERESAQVSVDPALGLLYFGGSDGFLHVHDAGSGAFVKRTKLDGNLMVGLEQSEDALFFGTSKGVFYRFNKADLKPAWQASLDSEIVSKPVNSGATLYVVTANATLFALNANDGSVKWHYNRKLPSRIFLRGVSEPALLPGNGIMQLVVGDANGRLQIFDAADGRMLKETQLGKVQDPFPDVITTPLVSQDRVYAAAYNRGVFALDHDLKKQWEVEIKGVAQMQLAKDQLIVATPKLVMALSIKDGQVLWQYAMSKGTPTPIQVWKDRVFVAGDRGPFVVLDVTTGRRMELMGTSLGYMSGICSTESKAYALGGSGYLYSFVPNYEVAGRGPQR